MAKAELKKALDSTDEIELTVTGRKSGRKTSRPVRFIQEGEKVYLLPVKGSRHRVVQERTEESNHHYNCQRPQVERQGHIHQRSGEGQSSGRKVPSQVRSRQR